MTKLPPLGFISVDIHFPRPPGDPYNDQTWPFPLIREAATGSTESQIVTRDSYDAGFIDRFVDAGLRLAARGCVGIITSCGFLAMAQKELSARLPIPIATSALVQLPSILQLLPPSAKVGVLTYDDARLGVAHLRSVGVSEEDIDQVRIRGAPRNGHLRRMIQEGAAYVHAELEKELVETARELVEECTEIRALLLECTQMPPFADAIQEAVQMPVYDVYTMGMWVYSGLARSRPRDWGSILN